MTTPTAGSADAQACARIDARYAAVRVAEYLDVLAERAQYGTISAEHIHGFGTVGGQIVLTASDLRLLTAAVLRG